MDLYLDMASNNVRGNVQPCCINVEGFPCNTTESQVRQIFRNCMKTTCIRSTPFQQTKWLICFPHRDEAEVFLKRKTIHLGNCVLRIEQCLPEDIPFSWRKADPQPFHGPRPGSEGMYWMPQYPGHYAQRFPGQYPQVPPYSSRKDLGTVELGMIKVSDLSSKTTVDTLTFYFENRRKSGGGEIEKIDFEEGSATAVISFKDPAVIKTVLIREHKLDGVKLEVKQYIPQPPPKPRFMYPDKVLVKGKNPDTTKDGLENFLEAKANVTPIDFIYGEEEDTVLITFEEPPDFEKLELACKKKALDKHFLKVFRVPISNCILVKGAGEKTTISTLELYFENTRRSGGGDVTEVKDQEDGSYLVYFEDHTVIDRVCGRSHTVDNITLDVKLYHEQIGNSGEDGPKFKVPDVLVITDLDPRKVHFVQHSEPNKEGLEKQLSTQHTKITWPERLAEPVKLECLLTKDIKDCRNLAKTWKQTARASLEKFFDVVAVIKHQILHDAWDGVLEKLQNMTICHPDGVTVAVKKVSFEIFVIGHRKFVTEVSQNVEKIIKGIADELERKKKQVKETSSPMKHHQVIMLSHTHYTETMKKKYPGMKVSLDFKARAVTYEGLYGDVTSAKIEMYVIINAMVSSDVGDFNKGRYSYLQEKAVKQYVAGKMKEKKIKSVWEMQDNRFVVYAMTDTDAVEAADILKDSILETIVDVKKESCPLLVSERWASEEQNIKDSCRVRIRMKVDTIKPCIVIYSTDADAAMVRERVADFLTTNTIYNTTSANRGTLRCLQTECDTILKHDNFAQVAIDINRHGKEMIGTWEGLLKRNMDTNSALDSVKQRGFEVRNKESKDDNIGEGTGDRWTPMTRQRGGIQEMARCSQSSYHLMVMLGDITNLKVDVLVNATNKELQHTEGLGKTIIDKGGESIQLDCDEYLKRHNKLLEGDVYFGKPGNLPCNFIAHAVGPVWQGGRSNEEDILRIAILMSMEEANSHHQTSIAIPAFKEGAFTYPANQSTKTIVEAVGEFLSGNPGCSVKDVYLCDENPNNVSFFIKALQNQFGTGNVIVPGHDRGSRDETSTLQAKPKTGLEMAVTASTKTEQLGMIKVSELSPKTTEDTLIYFFENRRSGGGEIEEVDFEEGSATAIITFKDPGVVDRVLQKLPLMLDKTIIKVERYIPER